MRRTAQVFALIGTLSIALLGVLMGGAGVVAGLFAADLERLMLVTLGFSFLALCAGLGLAMAWQSWQAMQGNPSRTFAIRRPVFLVVAFLSAVALGHLALSLDLLPFVVLPPLHVVAMGLPPVFVLALVAAGLGAEVSWRGAILQLGSGAFLSTALAIVLELVLIVALVLVLLAVLLAYGGLDTLEPLFEQLQDPSIVQDPEFLASLARSPLVIAAVLFVAAVAIPVIEEAVKTVGVGLFSYKHPSRAKSFFWGIACGAGFAMAEGLFNSISGLDSWSSVVLLRLGATLLHCLTGGLVGLAWYEIVAERRWTRGLGLFASGAGIHGFWNAVSIMLGLVSLSGLLDETGTVGSLWSGLATVALFAALVVAVMATTVSLVMLTRYVRRVGFASSISGESEGESRLAMPLDAESATDAGEGPSA